MLRPLSAVALAAALLVPVSAAPAAAAPLPGAVGAATAVAISPAQAYQNRVLVLTNAQRTSRGLRPLAFSSCADWYANGWSGVLRSLGTLRHQPLSPILTRCRARSVGENVGYGNVTPERLVAMWMASPGHRANILNSRFTHIGVGAVNNSSGRWYGVQVFLRV